MGFTVAVVGLAGLAWLAGCCWGWTCVDVLCAYLRLPYDPDPGDDARPDERTAYQANREVRHTIIRLIAAHLRPAAAVSWQGLNFDFTGVIFDGGDCTGTRFSSGIVLFDGAVFSSNQVSFYGAQFSGGEVSFDGAPEPPLFARSRDQGRQARYPDDAAPVIGVDDGQVDTVDLRGRAKCVSS